MNNSFIIDCSATMSLFLPDEYIHNYHNRISYLLQNNTCYVPNIWSYEVHNVLLSCKKRQRLDDVQISNILNLINELPICIENNNFHFISKHIFQLADLYKLSIYDASYIQLAQHLNCALATLDKQLTNVASQLNISIIS